jgi:hypothetical protein
VSDADDTAADAIDPADMGSLEQDTLWDAFHTVVNMTSDELSAWLRTSAAGEESEEVPEASGPPLGRAVLSILQKRRTDLTDADVRVMLEVVERVKDANEHRPAEGADDSEWRHRLMLLGHDPLRPSSPTG